MVYASKLDPHIYTSLDFTIPIPAKVCGEEFKLELTIARVMPENRKIALELDRIKPDYAACTECPKFLVCQTRPCLIEHCAYGCDRDSWAWHVSYPDCSTQRISCPAVILQNGRHHNLTCPTCLAKRIPRDVRTLSLRVSNCNKSPSWVSADILRDLSIALMFTGWELTSSRIIT